MIRPIKVGLLPLYVRLYDDTLPHLRPRLEAFYERIASRLEKHGFQVVRSPFCRLAAEFRSAVRRFEDEGAQAVVTLHMAYSPSLEAVNALCGTALPLLVLDTTETREFGFHQDPGEVLYNHGIHGVMDLCAMLTRRDRPYLVCAGHWEDPALYAKLERAAGAAVMANAFHGMRVGRVGAPFAGMGDFQVEDGRLLHDLGLEVVPFTWRDQALFAVKNEMAEDEARDWCGTYRRGEVSDEVLRRSAESCLGLRRWIETQRLGALSVNFMAVRAEGWPRVMPFVELCRAMERGIGYAGEGDVLTAALVAALLRRSRDSSFVEIFCPDWAGNSLFLSHMGEMNPRLARTRPLLTRMSFPYTDAADPAVLRGAYRAGPAVYVNLTPRAKGYHLFAAEVEMLCDGEDAFSGDVRGWMRPGGSLPSFLEAHSEAGAGHHAAVQYGGDPEEFRLLARLMNISFTLYS